MHNSSNPNYRYKVIRELGHNRFGGRVTYLARDTKTGQSVVIKQFQFVQSGSNWSGFNAHEREIQVLRSLNYSGIPRYLNSFENSKGFCIVQEYKDAESLTVPRSFDPCQIKQIAISVLDILVYLQTRIPPIIHRDIKPENILIDNQLNIYLVDFGFARIGDGERTMSSVAAGTFGFMPPEQIYNRRLSNATDLYSLGITLICLLTGIKSSEIGELIDERGCINFQPLVSHLNPHLIHWLERMVQPNPKDRYSSAATAKAALQPISLNSISEVQLSHPSLKFKAIRPNQKLTQTPGIINYLPVSVREGTWEVAPHPDDPPHFPHSHEWISFAPAQLTRHQAECQITVDTSKLMPDQIYERQILLHVIFPEEINYSLTVKVQTSRSLKGIKNQLIYFLKSLNLPKSQASQKQLNNSTEAEITIALTRRGIPTWTEEDFQKLLYTLGCAGYGWLRPEGVRQQLGMMKKNRQRLVSHSGISRGKNTQTL